MVPYDRQAGSADAVEKCYVDLVYQPITDAQGQVSGNFVDGIDVTDRIEAQEAIRASEARFRTFAQVMPNHVWTARPDGMLDWINERITEYSGRPAEALLGAGWGEIVHPLDLPVAVERWSQAINKGEAYETEFRIRNAAGAYRWHLVRAFPIRGDTGVIIQWIGTNTDIEAQKQAEAETTRDRNRIWALSQDLMMVTDFDGVITAVNPSARRMLGWGEDEMIGRPVTDFLHSDDADRSMSEMVRIIAGSRAASFENRMLGKDGAYRTLDWTSAAEAGRIHGIGRDITEFRRLSRERERIWNISPVLMVVVRVDGTISDANPSWTKVLGWLPAETMDRKMLDFLAPEDRERGLRNLATLKTSSGMISTESIYMTRDGGKRRIAWSIIMDSDTIYGFGRDITAETEAAAALAASEATLRQSQKMESIGQLTGGVAHDFNNLLQVIGSNLQLLTKDMTGNDRGTRRVGNALEAVTRGARLVSQLLAFGRRQPLSPKVVNLGRLVREMDDILRRTLGEAIEIETVVAGGLWHTMVDPGNVENALLNLAINARDAMEGRGNLTVEVGNAYLDDDYAQTAQDITPGQYVMLAVTDTGSGIAPEIMEKVFEPFFTTKPEGRGTGLGLSMVYGFVKQSGGHVKIYSEPGHGTTIRLYLPRSLVSEDYVVTRDNGPITGGAETILVAEDDDRVRESVIDMLKELGYRVLQAPDAQSALAIIESGLAVDLLFTDVIMPGNLKSTELARMAIERLPGLQVLFTSGYSENSIVHSGRLDPGVELLSKPYTREALARKVRQLLSGGAKVQPSQLAPPAPSAVALTVLLCEDDAFIRMDTTEMLQDLGCTVIETSTAKAALAALAVNSVDILMTDVGLPDMPGDRLATEARAIDPSLLVVFATGHSTVEGFPADNRTCVLSKPYDSTALEACIKSLCKTVPDLH